jgi:hypothetical protein
MSMSQCAQCHPVENGIAETVVAAAFFGLAGDTPVSTESAMMLILPFPKRSAVSIASINRARLSSEIVMRS